MDDNENTKDRKYHHGDLKASLVEVARSMLEESGPEAISFREIARQVGVSRTAPYNHFQSKEHLLATVAEGGFRDFHDFMIDYAKDAETLEGRIVGKLEAYIIFAQKRPQLYRLMFGVGIEDWYAYPEVKQAAKCSYEPLIEAISKYYIDRGIAHEEAIETASIAFWSMFHGFAMLLLDGKLNPANYNDATATDIAKRLARWLIAGLEAGYEDLVKA